jgi:hypothetical protein
MTDISPQKRADDWWERCATDSEKATLEWVQQHAPLSARVVAEIGHDGLIVRPGAKIPEWWYRLKYPKKKLT